MPGNKRCAYMYSLPTGGEPIETMIRFVSLRLGTADNGGQQEEIIRSKALGNNV